MLSEHTSTKNLHEDSGLDHLATCANTSVVLIIVM